MYGNSVRITEFLLIPILITIPGTLHTKNSVCYLHNLYISQTGDKMLILQTFDFLNERMKKGQNIVILNSKFKKYMYIKIKFIQNHIIVNKTKG